MDEDCICVNGLWLRDKKKKRYKAFEVSKTTKLSDYVRSFLSIRAPVSPAVANLSLLKG